MKRQTGLPIGGLIGLLVLAVVAWVLTWTSRGPIEAGPTDPAHDPATPVAVAGLDDRAPDPPAPDAATRTVLDAPPASARAAEPGPDALWGRVVAAADDAPVIGADVRLRYRDADQFWNLDIEYGAQVDELDRATSDLDGRFRFTVARARAHRLTVHARGFAPAEVTRCAGGAEVVVRMFRGAAVEGTVTSGGAPLADVPIRIGVEGESIELATSRTGPDGAYRITDLRPSKAFVQVQDPTRSEFWQRVRLREGERHHVDIDVPVGRELRGVVRDAISGAPVAGAEITDSWTFGRTVRTDAAGEFRLRGIEDGEFAEVFVRAEGYAGASRTLTGTIEGPVEFLLVRGGAVTGRFVDAERRPVQSVYAAVGASYMASPGMQSTDWIRARVDGDGRFVAQGLRPDQHYWLFARSRGLGTRIYQLPRKLASDERIDIGDVVMRAAGGIEGRVVDEHGAPFAGIGVALQGTNSDAGAWLEGKPTAERVTQFESRSVGTDARGQFRFTDLATGRYTLSVRRRGSSDATRRSVDVLAGARAVDAELVVPRGLTIAGTLRRADGRRLGEDADEAWLQATPANLQSVTAQPDADGRFEFTGLTEDAYDITLSQGPTAMSLEPRRGVRPGADDVRLVLVPASSIAGRVVDQSGQGVTAHVYIEWVDANPGGARVHEADRDGNFRIDVPPGFRGSVHAMNPDDWMLQAKLTDVLAGATGLELTLQRATPGDGR